MSTEKRKKKARGRPPKQETPQLPATFDEIMQSVVKTRSTEELDAILEETKNEQQRQEQAPPRAPR